ncbi:MAG: FAD-dependent oxidoreductase [candidate division WOR-3 bacterium]|nr:MAG: FAD-dependent oxidoreductase [candidate division WOR-3 bacterium]
MNLDVVIVGGGPAGLSAGIYGARAGLRTAIIEMSVPGGHTATTHYIENYPGFPNGINGFELAERMKEQVLRFGVELIGTQARAIKKNDGSFVVVTDSRELAARALIVAIGTEWKKLNVPGEDKLRGRGVSYCATCDGPLFRKRDVAVVGCGNSGIQEGHFLLEFVNHVTFVEFLPEVTADKILFDRVKEDKRADFLLNHEVVSIDGSGRVESITVRDRKKGVERVVAVGGVFVYVGLKPHVGLLGDLVELDDRGFVKVDERMGTSQPGVFAAGDICSKEIRQVVTACAEGATAAMSAYHYIRSFGI